MEERPFRLRDGIITKVERAPGAAHRYKITIDGETVLSVHEDLMIRHRLLKGETIQAEQLAELLQEEERQKAYLYAIKLLSSRLRSEFELKERMKQKGMEQDTIVHVLDRLRREKYVDDGLFAEQLAAQRIRSQKKGRLFIKQELKAKGIPPEQIARTMEQIDEETEFRMACELALKRYKPQPEAEQERKARQKLAAYLQRRGYSLAIVRRVLRQLPEGKDAGVGEQDWIE